MISITISAKFLRTARSAAKKQRRSISEQVEHWARIGKMAEENPNLTYEFVKKILIAKRDISEGHIEPYELD